MSNSGGEGLPPELIEYIDDLGTNEIPGMGETEAIEFRFAYGSLEKQDELEETINEQLALHAEGYLSDLDIFLSTSPDNGLPSFAYHGFEAEAQHYESGRDLERWLTLAKEHLPGAEEEVMADIVTHIEEHFDFRQFTAGIADASKDMHLFGRQNAEHAMQNAAAELVQDTTGQLCMFTNDADVVERFMRSELVRHFGEDNDMAILKSLLSELRGESKSYTYAEVAANAAQKLTGEPAGQNVLGYGEFMERHFKDTGTVDPAHVGRLKALVEAGQMSSRWGFRVLYANIPIDEVSSLIERHPHSLNSQGARAICVRRFAAEGNIQKAYELATTEKSVYESVADPIHNLLAIYEVSGDETAYLEAEQRLQTARSAMSLGPDSYALHGCLARIFVAAQKQGHTARVEQALTAMEPFYSEKSYDVQDNSLRTILRVSLDNGDLAAAERYAVRLKKIRDKRYAHDGQESTEGLLHVVQAYMRNNDTAAATRVVRTYFATNRPVYALKTAISLLSNQKPEYMPQLFVGHIDEVALLKAQETDDTPTA